MRSIMIMKKTIACILSTTLLITGTLANVPQAFAAEENTTYAADASTDEQKLYIKELRLGEGITADEAQKSLLSEGYLLLEKDGQPVDLNKGSATSASFSKSPSNVYVYLGYKTTTDPKEAITDIAVMNMKGGYNFNDYQKLIENNLETKIKPFMNRFVDTIREYRENYKKSEKSINHIKADMIRQLLNRYTDDDTDGSPIGDLLLNETKYEMGDKAYNALSDTEKKKHADILTMLMQGNLTNIQVVEKLLARAADSSDDTWIDRFEDMTLDKLREQIEEENPNADMSDIEKELDKKYNDAAKQILYSWDDFAVIAENYEEKQDELIEASEELEEKTEELKEDAEEFDKNEDPENISDEKIADSYEKMFEAEEMVLEQTQDTLAVAVSAQAETRETEDMNMREFFSQPAAVFSGENIRDLYPMVASLSKGQIAALEFLSIADLLDAGFNNIASLQKNMDMIDTVPVTSFYEGVNREIFEPGAVAMTNDALRQEAVGQSESSISAFKGQLAASAFFMIFGAVGFVAAGIKLNNLITPVANELAKITKKINKAVEVLGADNPYTMFWTPEWKGQAGVLGNKLSHLKFVRGVICGVFALLAAAGIALTIYAFYTYYHIDYVPIPKYIVDEADITTYNEKGEKEFIRNDTAYYRAVDCNRETMNKGSFEKHYNKRIEEIGSRGDLNGAAGREWLALYTVKNVNGAPILADSLLVQTGEKSSSVPDGYTTGIHMFGEKNAYNLQNQNLVFGDPEAIRVYFKQDTQAYVSKDASTTGSFISSGSKILFLVIGFACGALVVWCIMFIIGRRKKNLAAG